MFDTIIIGGGPAGYLAAQRLGQQKKKVFLIEEQQLGGTCLNVGCIPTKTLLNSAKLYIHTKKAEKFGVKTKDVSFDWTAIQNWKTEVITGLRGGIKNQLKRFGVEIINGKGEILEAPSGNKPAKIRVLTSNAEPLILECKTILVSTGSVPVMPSIPGAKDNPLVVDSTGLLNVKAVPRRLIIIGGGVIGVEFAGLFSALGTSNAPAPQGSSASFQRSEVTVIEMMNEILPFMDRELAPLLRRVMNAWDPAGPLDFKLGCKVEMIDGGSVHYTANEGKSELKQADLILMAVGRRPLIEGWGAETAGINTNVKGVAVDDRMRTNISGIWAAGDVTGKSFFAHSAYRMAEVAVSDILGFLDGKTSNNKMRYNAIPWVVYGLTEAAGVGLTEQEAETKGIEILKTSLPMQFSGRFVAENTPQLQGAVKLIADAKDRRILGIHAVGSYASEFIWGGAALIEQEFRIDEVKQLVFPHPTVAELIRDAAWAIESK